MIQIGMENARIFDGVSTNCADKVSFVIANGLRREVDLILRGKISENRFC